MCLLQFGIGSCGTGNQEHETTGNVNSTRYSNYCTCKWWRKMAWSTDGSSVGWKLDSSSGFACSPGVLSSSPCLPSQGLSRGWWEDGWTDTMPVFCIHTHIPSVWWMIMFGLRVSGITVVSINCRSGPGVALRAENQKILSHKDWFPPKKKVLRAFMENIKHQSPFFSGRGGGQKVLFQFRKENTVPISTIFHNIWQFCCINRKEEVL